MTSARSFETDADKTSSIPTAEALVALNVAWLRVVYETEDHRVIDEALLAAELSASIVMVKDVSRNPIYIDLRPGT